MADLMDDTPLNFGCRKDGMDGLLKSSQTINAGDEEVLDATRL
jgi:hypothetical protein